MEQNCKTSRGYSYATLFTYLSMVYYVVNKLDGRDNLIFELDSEL